MQINGCVSPSQTCPVQATSHLHTYIALKMFVCVCAVAAVTMGVNPTSSFMTQATFTSIICATLFLRTHIAPDGIDNAHLYAGFLFFALLQMFFNGIAEMTFTVSQCSSNILHHPHCLISCQQCHALLWSPLNSKFQLFKFNNINDSYWLNHPNSKSVITVATCHVNSHSASTCVPLRSYGQ